MTMLTILEVNNVKKGLELVTKVRENGLDMRVFRIVTEDQLMDIIDNNDIIYDNKEVEKTVLELLYIR